MFLVAQSISVADVFVWSGIWRSLTDAENRRADEEDNYEANLYRRHRSKYLRDMSQVTRFHSEPPF